MRIGYARISTLDQNLDLQEFARSGDTVVVWKLDRLGRSLKHLIEIINLLHERKVGFMSLQEKIDTTSARRQVDFSRLRRISRI